MRTTGLLALATLLTSGHGVCHAEEPSADAKRSELRRFYNVDTVETLKGEVMRVEKVANKRKRGYGVHLMLKTDKELVPVRLGPGWYIERQKVNLQPKDVIEVKGSRLTLGGKPTIVAAEVHKGAKVWKLRDDTGEPLWRKKRPT